MSDLNDKGFCASTMTYYAVTFAEIRLVAKNLGYALCLHGSLRKDLDVVAVPWVEEAADEETLVKAIVEAAGGYLVCNREGQHNGIKPHGRHAWTIHFGGCSGTVSPEDRATYIDLSVMPKSGLLVAVRELMAFLNANVDREPDRAIEWPLSLIARDEATGLKLSELLTRLERVAGR